MTGLIGLIHFSTTFRQLVQLGQQTCRGRAALGATWGRHGDTQAGVGKAGASGISPTSSAFQARSRRRGRQEAWPRAWVAQRLCSRRVCPRESGQRQSTGGRELWKPRLRLPGGDSDRSDLQAGRVRGAVTQPRSVQEWPCGPSSPCHQHATDTRRALGASPPQRCRAAPARAVLRT